MTDTKTISSVDLTSDNISSFNMKAFFEDQDLIIGASNAFVSYTKSSDKFTTTDKYFWPETSNTKDVTFYAFSENSGSTSLSDKVTATKDGMKITEYQISTDASTSITADPSTTERKQYDPCVAATNSKMNKTGVSLEFNHILARIQVRAKSTINTSKLIAQFLGYEFQNVGVKGTTNVFTPTTSLSWSSVTPGNVRDNRYKNVARITTSTPITQMATTNSTALADDSWCNVIPGTIPINFKLIVKVAFYESTSKYYIGTRYLTVDKTGLGGVDSFDAGKQYYYDIEVVNGGGGDTDDTGNDFNLDDLEIKILNITVQPWATAVQGGSKIFGN